MVGTVIAVYETYDNMQEMRFEFTGNPLDAEELNSFVRRFVGNLCFVSHMPQSIDDQISIGVWDDRIVIDSENEPRMHMVGYLDIFKGFFEMGDNGLNLVVPSRMEIAEEITKTLKSNRNPVLLWE